MKSPGSSIFFKLFFIFFLNLLIMSAGVIIFKIITFSTQNVEVSKENVRYLGQHFAEIIGSPPDIDEAENLIVKHHLAITISGPGYFWTSEKEAEEIDTFQFLENSFFPLLFVRKMDYPVIVNAHGYTYRFTDFHEDFRFSLHAWLILITSIVGSLVLNYLLVRRMLRPIRTMNNVALEFGVSHWKNRVHPTGSDELAVLGREMDIMADRIENYISSMQDLIAAVSHELRSPLTRLKLSLEFIDNAGIKESMNEEIDSMNFLIGNILEQKRLMTQPHTLNMETFNPEVWLMSFAESYRLRGLNVTLAESTADLSVTLDQGRLDLALRNIVENALRHAPDSEIIMRYGSNKSDFYISVEDNGPGMPEDLISRLGEPFLLGNSSRTGSRQSGGFGLGFSIIRAVAEAHRGNMTVKNRSGKGLVVVLTFPGRR